MSDHDCGCSCKKIIVQCGSGGGEVPPPPPPSIRYSCINGQCVPDLNGAYSNLGACQEACRIPPPPPPPTRYSCVNGQCVPDPNGAYASLGACQEVCRIPPPPPPPRPICERVRVSFVSLVDVTDDGESGNGDWTLEFDVNGFTNSHDFADDLIDDDLSSQSYPINKSVEVPIDQFTRELSIRIGGKERDGSIFNGGDDDLAEVHATFTQADNFGIGRVEDLRSDPPGSGQVGAYSVRVRIDCLRQTSSVVSLATLKAASLWRVERENKKRQRIGLPPLSTDESALLDQSLRRLRDNGWLLKTIHGENFIFEGSGGPLDLRTKDPRTQSKEPIKS